jgi:DnaJ-class molecular chaperone
MTHEHPCPYCDGTGCEHVEDYMIDEPCDHCAGEGIDPDWDE